MALEIKSLSFGFQGKPLIKEASASFPPSSVSAVLGPNGTGKSTLLRMILGLLKPASGTVLLGGRDVSSFSHLERAKSFSYLPQRAVYNEEWTLGELAQKGDHPHKRLPPPPRPFETRRRIAEEGLELKDLWGRKMSTLSGGEAQRGLIARVVIQDSGVMILDEPSNHLDLYHRLQLFELLEKLKNEGKTIVYAVHDFNISLQFNHRILVMGREGKLIEISPRAEEMKKILKETYEVDFSSVDASGFSYFYPNRRYR